MIVESDSCDVALGGLAFINICAILEREHDPKKYRKLAGCGTRFSHGPRLLSLGV